MQIRPASLPVDRRMESGHETEKVVSGMRISHNAIAREVDSHHVSGVMRELASGEVPLYF